MRKFVISAIVIIALITIVFSILVISTNRGYQKNVSIIENFDKKDYWLIEKEFSVKLPNGSKIERVALTKGKDACLSVKVIMPEENIITFNKSIGFETEPDVSIDSSVEKVLKSRNSKSYMKIIYFKPDSRGVRIDLVKYEPLSKDIWDILKKAGVRSLK